MSWFSKLLRGARTRYSPNPTYVALRSQVLGLGGHPGSPALAGVAAIVMDTGLEEDCYTFAAMADGTLSLYFSNGGGIIGTGAYPGVNTKCRDLVARSAKYRGALKPATEFALPSPGTVALHLVSLEGVFRTEAKEADLGHNREALSPWFHEIHGLIALIREVSEMKEGEKPLVFAAAMNLSEQAVAELAAGTNPNTLSSTGIPAVAIAAMSGSGDVLKLLMDAGANVDVTIHVDTNRVTPLICRIAGAGDEAVLELLLQGGANIGATDSTGLTALHISGYLGHEAIAAQLINRGASIEARDNDGYTPLMMAANAGQKATVDLLVRHGADPNAGDKDGSTSVMFAAQHGHLAIVDCLLKAGASPMRKGNHQFSAVDFAKQNGHHDVVRLLLAH